MKKSNNPAQGSTEKMLRDYRTHYLTKNKLQQIKHKKPPKKETIQFAITLILYKVKHTQKNLEAQIHLNHHLQIISGSVREEREMYITRIDSGSQN